MDAGPGAVWEVCHYVIYDSFAVSVCIRTVIMFIQRILLYHMHVHAFFDSFLLKYTNCVTLLQQVIKTLYALNTFQRIFGNNVK